MPTFTNKVIVVTAAGSPVGQAIALRLAAEDARLVLVDTDTAAGMATLALVKQHTDACLFIQADVSQAAEIAVVRERTLAAYNALHSLVHTVDTGAPKPLHLLTEADWDEAQRLCLNSVYLCYRTFIPLMLQTGGGSFVTITSMLGLASRLDYGATAAAMGAVITLSKATAVDFASQGIRVNCVCPSDEEPQLSESGLSTLPTGDDLRQAFLARHPMQRLARAEEVAEAAVWLASDAASFITGAALPVDGGLTAW